jgi:hypothetical protein
VVEDTLEMAEDHEVELFFHCHEESEVRAAGEGFVVRAAMPSCGSAFQRRPRPRCRSIAAAWRPWRAGFRAPSTAAGRADHRVARAPHRTSVLRTEILVGPI